jgi:hypothetical protein
MVEILDEERMLVEVKMVEFVDDELVEELHVVLVEQELK